MLGQWAIFGTEIYSTCSAFGTPSQRQVGATALTGILHTQIPVSYTHSDTCIIHTQRYL